MKEPLTVCSESRQHTPRFQALPPPLCRYILPPLSVISPPATRHRGRRAHPLTVDALDYWRWWTISDIGTRRHSAVGADALLDDASRSRFSRRLLGTVRPHFDTHQPSTNHSSLMSPFKLLCALAVLLAYTALTSAVPASSRDSTSYRQPGSTPSCGIGARAILVPPSDVDLWLAQSPELQTTWLDSLPAELEAELNQQAASLGVTVSELGPMAVACIRHDKLNDVGAAMDQMRAMSASDNQKSTSAGQVMQVMQMTRRRQQGQRTTLQKYSKTKLQLSLTLPLSFLSLCALFLSCVTDSQRRDRQAQEESDSPVTAYFPRRVSVSHIVYTASDPRSYSFVFLFCVCLVSVLGRRKECRNQLASH